MDLTTVLAERTDLTTTMDLLTTTGGEGASLSLLVMLSFFFEIEYFDHEVSRAGGLKVLFPVGRTKPVNNSTRENLTGTELVHHFV